jgi:hypothetical protein
MLCISLLGFTVGSAVVSGPPCPYIDRAVTHTRLYLIYYFPGPFPGFPPCSRSIFLSLAAMPSHHHLTPHCSPSSLKIVRMLCITF